MVTSTEIASGFPECTNLSLGKKLIKFYSKYSKIELFELKVKSENEKNFTSAPVIAQESTFLRDSGEC